MDLLLHLVRQQEVDIHEVSLARILEDYLAHLKILQQLDLHDIGDFVVMASTLMEIKSRELLPNETVEIEEELDPRDDLIRRLLEYKRYRDLARQLEVRSDRRARMTPLVLAKPPELAEPDDEDQLELGDVGIWDLTSAFARLLEEIGQQGAMQIEVEKRDVAFYIDRMIVKFRDRRELAFSDVFDKAHGRYGLIGSLQACLEMMKQGYLRAHQPACFDEIQLVFLGEPDVTADQIMAGITADEEQERQRRELAVEVAEEAAVDAGADDGAGADDAVEDGES